MFTVCERYSRGAVVTVRARPAVRRPDSVRYTSEPESAAAAAGPAAAAHDPADGRVRPARPVHQLHTGRLGRRRVPQVSGVGPGRFGYVWWARRLAGDLSTSETDAPLYLHMYVCSVAVMPVSSVNLFAAAACLRVPWCRYALLI